VAEVEGAAGVAGAAEVSVAAFLACFLCFFTLTGFTGAGVAAGSVVVADFGFVVALSAWAKDRAAARAVPNIKAVKRFMLCNSP